MCIRDRHYADAIERLLYNMIATSPNAEGDRFFYVNPLLVREPGISTAEGEAPFRKDTLRSTWFWVACCPTNVVRLLSSLTGYFATVHEDALTVQQYFTGEISTRLEDGREVHVEVTTDYPWNGTISVRVPRSPGRWTLRLRVPSWADGATLEVDGGVRAVKAGYAGVTRDWTVGDVVVLHLPMAARLLRADSRIDALRGTAAVQRGPLVYCAESVVSADGAVDLDSFRLDPSTRLESVPAAGPSDTAEVVRVHGVVAAAETSREWPYPAPASGGGAPSDVPDPGPGSAEIDLVPYCAWSNRGPSTMRVWIPLADTADLVRPASRT